MTVLASAVDQVNTQIDLGNSDEPPEKEVLIYLFIYLFINQSFLVPLQLPLSSDLENSDQFPVQEVFGDTDYCAL